MPIAEAFRSVCEARQPEVALFYTRPDEVEPEYIDAQYPKVLGLSGILLSDLAEYFPTRIASAATHCLSAKGCCCFAAATSAGGGNEPPPPDRAG
jgi:hypothetical protein